MITSEKVFEKMYGENFNELTPVLKLAFKEMACKVAAQYLLEVLNEDSQPTVINIKSLKPSDLSWSPNDLVIDVQGLKITLANDVLLTLKGSIDTIKK